MTTELRKGLKDAWAVAPGLIPLGLAFGLLVVQMGFAWWWAPIFSVVIYAGSMEYLALGMVTGGAGWFTSLLTGFLVNFRHIFYGLTYPRHRIHSGLGKGYATYALTDEVYAITSVFGPEGVSRETSVSGTRLLSITAFCQVVWVLCGILGAVFGEAIQIDVEGLDFALTALFVVLAYEAFQANKDYSLPLSAIVLAVIVFAFLPSHMLLVALSAYFLLLVVRYLSPRLDSWMKI